MKTAQPFYVPDPPQRVECGSFYGSQPTAESMMQEAVRQVFTYPQGFLWGSAGSGSETPDSMKKHFIAYAQSLTQSPIASKTAVSFDGTPFDPTNSGTHYANVVIDILKDIDVSIFNWMETGSLYDAWMRRQGA